MMDPAAALLTSSLAYNLELCAAVGLEPAGVAAVGSLVIFIRKGRAKRIATAAAP
jgi:hydrogenase maturation factor